MLSKRKTNTNQAFIMVGLIDERGRENVSITYTLSPQIKQVLLTKQREVNEIFERYANSILDDIKAIKIGPTN